jgi:tRNA 2-thiouridine synthesizing protein B
MTLHLIQKSPFTTSVLQNCLDVINEEDIILLMQDGVYSCQLPTLSTIENRILVLRDDLDARGIQADKTDIEIISYENFVTFCTQCKNIISWY